MAAKRVSEAMAKRVLKAIHEKYPEDAKSHGPEILRDWDGRDFVILWEPGPEGWTYEFFYSDSLVWSEAVNTCMISLYRH